MNVSLLIVAFVATITSAHHYAEPMCPVDEEVQCQVRCNVQVDDPICAIPSGWQGPPITLRNRCVLLSYNCGCQSFQYEYLHDGKCLDVVCGPVLE